MSSDRQQAFLRLKPPCVNLSSVALKFRTKEVSIKDVLGALETVRDTLEILARTNRLDAKLAEYAFFPLAQQVFNEAKKLSPRCLEIAADCVTILVSNGYRESLLPELGKQLLILMSMLAGTGPSAQSQPPTDDLKIASLRCISAVTVALASSKDGRLVFDDQGTRNVVDQLVYLLLDAITESASDQVQILASSTLNGVIRSIYSRVFLASLLPRTVSSLTKALRPSTQARRTQRVLVSYLETFQNILLKTLGDDIASKAQNEDEKQILDQAWSKATTAQIKNALLQVNKLRAHDGTMVRDALAQLCAALIEQCQRTLSESVPLMLETLMILSSQADGQNTSAICRHLVLAYPDLLDILQRSFTDWSRSLPRQLQSQDSNTRSTALRRLMSTLPLISEARPNTDLAVNLLPLLKNGILSILHDAPNKLIELSEMTISPASLLKVNSNPSGVFEKFILNHGSQKHTRNQLQELVAVLRQLSNHISLIRNLVDSIAETDGEDRVVALWLANELLDSDLDPFSPENMLEFNDDRETVSPRVSLLADLHAYTFPLLSDTRQNVEQTESHWQSQALAMQSLVLYAETFDGQSYRPELLDTLYPVLALLGSSNSMLRSYAMAALNRLASACEYASTQDLLIQNVDYLVNSIAWKLNVYTLSPEAPHLLRMMVLLCGTELIPYLDDLIQSIFSALDNYHGYPEWVELLFSTLRSMVDVSIKEPQNAITADIKPSTQHGKASTLASNMSDIISDLHARKRRKLDFDRSASEPPTKAPHRPWTNMLDGPSFPAESGSEVTAVDGDDGEENDRLAPMKSPDDDKEPKLAKTHSLLLSIAQSTVPHLASPSARVRHLLLDLLKDIAPLLGRDERSFLPLINTIWPVVVPRLFADQSDDEEVSFNIVAAADTIGTLCVNAGDFMSGRIEDIFQQLVRLYKSIRSQVERNEGVQNSASGGTSIRKSESIVTYNDTNVSSLMLPSGENAKLVLSSSVRTSQGQVYTALIGLLIDILGHVSLTLDTGDTIVDLLLPLASRKADVRDALEKYNADMLWYWNIRQEMKDAYLGKDGMNGEHVTDTPELRAELLDLGLSLRPVVA